jgi:phosphoribosylformimino-5-aminoimidazole carboxamide ribotide isomerase
LQQGSRAQQTVYSLDPLTTAQAFLAQGATHLHVIDLDGAFAEASPNRAIIKNLAAALPARIQCGGGVRTLADVEELLQAGVARVILGTAAVRHPEIVASALEKFGAEAIAIAIDAREGLVAVAGWEQGTNLPAIEFANSMSALGARLVIYTDIARDGMLSGVNLPALKMMLENTDLRVIASGGFRDLNNLRQLHALAHPRLEGVILGRSLYEGTIQLQKALEWQEKA